jgi:putative ABC transport system permease protein
MLRRARIGLRAIRLLHLRELRLHPLRTLVSIISVAAGVAMILSVVVVVRSTTASFEHQARALAGPAPLRIVGVTSAGGLSPATVDAARGVDGVAAAVPMIRAVATLERDGPGRIESGDDVFVLGVDCQTATVLGVECARVTDAPLLSSALEADARAGSSLRTDTGRIALDASRVEPTLDALGDKVAAVSIPAAQAMFSRSTGVDVVFILPAEGVDPVALRPHLRAAVGEGTTVLGVTDPPVEFEQVLATIIPLFGIIGLFALAIGMILVANTVALSLEERRQQLAVVGALGGTASALVGGALVQAAVIGVLGGLLGVGGAIALAYPLTASVSTFTLPIAGVAVKAIPSEAPIRTALFLGAIVAVLAAWRPARRARRTDVAAELSNRDRRAEADTGRLAAVGLLAVAIGIAGAGITAVASADGSLDDWQPPLAPIGLLICVLGLSIGMSRITPVVAQVLLRRLNPRRATVRLALANLVREPARTGVMGLAIGSAVGVAFIVASFNAAAEAGITDGVTANLEGKVAISIGAPDSDDDGFARVPAPVIDAIRARPDVARVSHSSFMFVSDGVAMGLFATEDPSFSIEVYEGTADPERFAQGEVLIGAAVARRQHIEPGDTVAVPTPDGFAHLPVQGIWANGNVVGNIVDMPFTKLEELFGPRPTDQVLVTPADGVSDDDLAAAIVDAGYDPGLRAEPGDVLAARFASGVGAQLAPFWALQRGLTIVAFIAVLSTLLLVGIQRTRELGLLAAVGMEPGTIARMVVLEAIIVGAVGTVVGAVLSVGMDLAFLAITPLLLGWENPMRFALWAVPVYGVITVIVVAIGASLPAWRASRVHVVEALAYE